MKLFTIVFLLITLQLSGQQLSKYVSYKEATVTSHNIPNTPDWCQEARIKYVAENYFDPLRERVGVPLYITSCFRSPELNKAIGGATNSDHMILDDVVSFDIDQDGRGKISNKALMPIIMKEFNFYKLIIEFPNNGSPSWLHVGFSTTPFKNTLKRVYRAVKVGNKTTYQSVSLNTNTDTNTLIA